MKGLIFRNFLDFVEAQLGTEFLEDMLDSVSTNTSGAYTNVGTYDHHELLSYIVHIHEKTGLNIPAMVQQFGHKLFYQLAQTYPELIKSYKNSFDCIYHIDQTIHKNVTKIHPNAELPLMDATYSDDKKQLNLKYQSSRPFMYLALGLINGCVEYYGDQVNIEMEDFSDGKGNQAAFTLTCQTT